MEPIAINFNKTLTRKQLRQESFPKEPYQADRALAKACIEQDRRAQRKLFEQYKDSLYTLLCRMLVEEDEASDALQETFIKAFKGIASYQAKSSLWSWLRTIAIRTALNKQKKRKYHASIDEVDHELGERAIYWDDNLTGEYLEKAINKLSDGYRNVFILVEVEGYTHKEASEMLGIAPGTSKSQLFHAKKQLQKHLREIYQ